MRRIYLIFAVVLFTGSVFGQTLKQKADKSYQNRDYYNAITYYQKLIEASSDKKDKAVYNFRIAEAYRSSMNYTLAIKFYEAAISNNCVEEKLYTNYGLMLIMKGDYEKAKEQFKTALTKLPADSLAKRMMDVCDFATISSAEKAFYTIKNEPKINTKYSDYGVCMLSDTSLVFASSRMEDPLTEKIYEFNGQGFSDFYISKISNFDLTWKKGKKCEGGLNSPYNDGTMSFDRKNNKAYFMQCNGLEGKDNRCGIYTSIYNPSANTWSAAQVFEYQNPDCSIGHPMINKSGDMLIFVSDMIGGMGGKDLWMIKKNNGAWGSPENMGARINSSGDEMFPSLMNDTLLYFSSNGWKGYGGLDLFYVNLNDKSQKEPLNMKNPFNSGGDDFSVFFKNDQSGFFTSNRPGGLGDDDIYSFNAIPIVLLAKGVVKIKNSEEFIPNARVYIKGSDGHIDSTKSDAQGRYVFAKLDVNIDYQVTVKKEGYFGDTKSFSTKGINKSSLIAKSSGYDIDLMLDMAFALQKITKEEIEISDIFYDYDKVDLRAESKPQLMKLVKILQDNPEICILLNSHSDARGKAAYNKKLSEGRAKSCVTFLIEQGVDSKRLKFKGWGSSKLKIENAKTEEEHQVNRRTTFQVTNADQLEAIGQPNGVEFRLQFSSSKVLLTDKALAKVKATVPDLEVKNEKADDGDYKYTVGAFKTIEETTPYMKKLKAKGINAFVVAYNNGKKIDVEEAKKLVK